MCGRVVLLSGSIVFGRRSRVEEKDCSIGWRLRVLARGGEGEVSGRSWAQRSEQKSPGEQRRPAMAADCAVLVQCFVQRLCAGGLVA